MLTAGDARDNTGQPGYEASRDYIGSHVHGLGITHIDALCHMFVAGQMYNGVPAEEVRSDGARANTVMTLADGISGRGVLLDIPHARACLTSRVTTSSPKPTSTEPWRRPASVSGGRHSLGLDRPRRPASGCGRQPSASRRDIGPSSRVPPLAARPGRGHARQ